MEDLEQRPNTNLAMAAAGLLESHGSEVDTLVAQCQAAEALLTLGYWEEWAPELAAEQIEELPDKATGVLLDLARSTWRKELLLAEEQLAVVVAAPRDRLDVPVLCADPEEALAVQEAARAALLARERLHRLERAAALLSEAAMAGEPRERLLRFDHSLRELLPSLGILHAWRQAQARELPAGPQSEHWWLRQPVLPPGIEEPQESPPAAASEANASLSPQTFAGWLGARGVRAPGDRLVLDPDEARQLLSTERGRCLAAALGEGIDCGAVESAWSTATALGVTEPTVGDVLADLYGGVPSWASEGEATTPARGALSTLVERLTSMLGPPAPPELMLAAATTSAADRVVLERSARAIAELECEAAWLQPDVGVVAVGRRRRHGDSGARGPVWLLAPAPRVKAIEQRLAVGAPPTEVSVDGAALLLSWPAPGPGGDVIVAVSVEGIDEPSTLDLGSAGRDSLASSGHADSLTLLARALSHELFEDAEEVWDALRSELSAEQWRWGMGMEKLLGELLDGAQDEL